MARYYSKGGRQTTSDISYIYFLLEVRTQDLKIFLFRTYKDMYICVIIWTCIYVRSNINCYQSERMKTCTDHIQADIGEISIIS